MLIISVQNYTSNYPSIASKTLTVRKSSQAEKNWSIQQSVEVVMKTAQLQRHS